MQLSYLKHEGGGERDRNSKFKTVSEKECNAETQRRRDAKEKGMKKEGG
jgi:hypothetical protein